LLRALEIHATADFGEPPVDRKTTTKAELLQCLNLRVQVVFLPRAGNPAVHHDLTCCLVESGLQDSPHVSVSEVPLTGR
jgi:hypothetical protein